ncbi:MAG: N-acetyltransferase [Gammaproteobacteria bacterium]|nr:N-acetyltransferase [Gammaproteobacteria bacterium]
MKIVFTDRIASVEAEHWNNLAGDSNPFIQHDFLLALEQHDCLHNWGWFPQHCLLYDNETLIGACPAYIKDNSYGEFVFDWAWADAYQKNALDYYPKLVTSIPFTPAQGPRLLASTNHKDAHGRLIESATIKKGLINALIAFAEKNDLSSAHFLFCENDDIKILLETGLMLRSDYQFHWTNNNYQSFDDFLSCLTSKRRKNIRRERKKVADENIKIQIINGEELNDEQWELLYAYYRVTFLKKSGTATLTLDFFKAVAHKLLAIFATHENKIVAAAICFEGKNKLYGRHWGCSNNYNNLHFEVCYYTGIDYCINRQLQVFEPGAQGEHKIWRGFLPVKTQSAHWISHAGFKNAIEDFLQRETVAMQHHGELLLESSPYKSI